MALSLVIGLLGLAVVWGSSGMRLGTIGRMGPGYFPLAIGILLVLTALGIVLSERRGAPASESWDIRGLIAIPAAVGAFGLLLPQFGLLVACFVTVLIGRLGVSSNTVSGTIVLSLTLPVLIFAIFVLGLGLPLRILPA